MLYDTLFDQAMAFAAEKMARSLKAREAGDYDLAQKRRLHSYYWLDLAIGYASRGV